MFVPPNPPAEAPPKEASLAWPIRMIVGGVGGVAVVSGVNQVWHGIDEIKGSSLNWQRRAVAGLSVELPGAPAKEDIRPAAEAASRVKHLEMHGVKSNGALIRITHVAYTDATKVSMDAEVEGGKEALSASPGIDKLNMSVFETQVQNGPAKTMSADYTLPNFGEQHSESLYFSRGQESWIVVVMGVPAVAKEIARRLLPGVQVTF